jgi:ribosomal-protein-alanine N-acetyltransferase
MGRRPDAPELASTDIVAPATNTESRRASWRDQLPTLFGRLVTLRDLKMSDAPMLFTALTTDDVTRFISPPPSTVEGFEQFIAWSHRQRAAGQCVCFAIVPRGSDRAIGIFQVRALDLTFDTAEWGFAMAWEFWGTGTFVDGAERMLEFVFDTVAVHRLEARAAVCNGRGNGALRKLGAVQECVLRRSFLRRGEHLDQVLWTILAEDWREAAAASWEDLPVFVH